MRHGWILTREGALIDPTWWVFKAIEPQIRILLPGTDEFFEHAGDYDEGAETLSEYSRLFWPQAQKYEARHVISDAELVKRLRLEVRKYHPLEELDDAFTMAQLAWLCRTRYSAWGTDVAARLYAQVQAAGHEAVIPTDFAARARREKRWANA